MESLTPLLVLFDGHCNLCSGAVQFILKRDRRHRFRFASLQGPTARRMLDGMDMKDIPDSIVLFEEGRMFVRSTAALRIARHLDGAWPLLHLLIIIPRPLRDMVYRYVARKRYGWFGQKEACWMPEPGHEAWFPDMDQKGE